MPKTSAMYLGILYPDCQEYDVQSVLNAIEVHFQEYAYITHDKDVDAKTGDLKKPHIHWVGRRKTEKGENSPCPMETVINNLDLPEKYKKDIEYCRSWKRSVRYLIHLDDPDKYQYDASEIVTNFETREIFADLKSSINVAKIWNHIDANPHISVIALGRWASENGCWAEFRRAWSFWGLVCGKSSEDDEERFARGS